MYTDTRDEYAAKRMGIVTQGIKVGDPVSIRYYTDTRAAVVTHVTAKTVTVQRVEVGPSRPDERCDVGAYGARPGMADGILDRPIEGTEQRFTYTKRGTFERQGLRLILGRSQDWVDYRL